jgi:hypothetical protein
MLKQQENELDLELVVTAVREASDNELRVLSEISDKLDNHDKQPVTNIEFPDIPSAKEIGKAVGKEVLHAKLSDVNQPTNTRQRRRTAVAAAKPKERKKELNITVDAPAPTSAVNAVATKQSEAIERLADVVSTKDSSAQSRDASTSNLIEQTTSSIERIERDKHVERDRKVESELSPIVLESPANEAATQDVPAPVVVEVPTTEHSHELVKETKSLANDFKDYWRDEKGNLRRANGQYASKDEQKAYAKSDSAELAKERESEQQQGVIAKLVSFTKNRTMTALKEENSAADTAGVAGGGSWFYAIKEMYKLGESAVELKNETKEKWDTLRGIYRDEQDPDSPEQEVKQTKLQAITNLFSSKRSLESTSSADVAKQSQRSEQLELLQEQTDAQQVNAENILEKLDELDVQSASGSGGGLFESVADMMDMGGDRKGRKGRKGGRLGGKSIIGRAANAAGSVAGKGMSMAGMAFKGVSTVAKGAARAVPFLAPILAMTEAVSGFTDTEKQKETFNLKEGEEATFGQKASMAAASVLDMGGLVSGGAGLLGDALGFMGFDGAKEALNFDSGDMAKGIFEMFGGEVASKEEIAHNEATPVTIEESGATTSNSSSVESASAIEKQSTETATDSVQNTQALTNQSVGVLQAESQQRELKAIKQPSVMELDQKTIDALVKGLGEGGGGTTSITNRTVNVSSPKASPSPSTGRIPTNFTDRSLQRQSADLE